MKRGFVMSLQSRNLMPDGLEYTINSIRRHRSVEDVFIETSDQYSAIIEIERKGFLSNIRAYVADVYILTVSDVEEVLSYYTDINCIVVISNWDHYTVEAKNVAKENGVGVFTGKEFMEALGKRGNQFLDTGYASKTERAM